MLRESFINTINYNIEDHIELNEFQKSPEYKRFKKEYISAIDFIKDFYLTHAEDNDSKISVEHGLDRFKDRLFGQNPELPQQLHNLFQGKKAIEEIALALIPAEGTAQFSSDEIAEKLAHIYNLAGGGPENHEVACLVCASGTMRNIIDTAQFISEGNLFDNIQKQRKNIFWDVIRKYVMVTHRSEIFQRVGGQNHDTNLMNAFINAFSEEWGFPLITEAYVDQSFVTEKDKETINYELEKAVTQDSIIDRLAADYLKKIKENITFNEDGTINLSSANIALDKFEKKYGKHAIYTVFSLNEAEQLIKVITDPTAIKVTINHLVSQENKNRYPPVNTFPLVWSEGIVINDNNQGKKLWRSGDLFWNELTDEFGDKTIILPTAQDLGEKYINMVGSSQLLQIISQNSSAENIAVLMKIRIEKLEALDNEKLTLFLSNLDINGSVSNVRNYIIQNKHWFNNLVKKLNYNPVISFVMTRLNPEQLAALPAEDIFLQGLSLSQARQFLLMLDPENSAARAIEYVTKYPEWFSSLVLKAGSNPLLPILLERLSHEELAALPPDHRMLQGLSPRQVDSFLSAMDAENSVDRAVAYVTKHQRWFKDLKRELGNNPVALLILKRLDSNQLADLVPDIALRQLSALQAKEFLSRLDLDGSMTKASAYITQHEQWFETLVFNTRSNPFFSLLLTRMTAEDLMNLPPDVALQGLSEKQAYAFFTILDMDKSSMINALSYANRYPAWFKDLVTRTKSNPLVPLRLTLEERVKLDPNVVLQGLSMDQCMTFLTKLDPDKSMTNAVAYVSQHEAWFSSLVRKYHKNPLVPLLLKYLLPKQLLAIPPDIALQGLSIPQAQQFFSYLDGDDSRMTNSLAYVAKNKSWFSNIVKQNNENPLISRLILWDPRELNKLDSNTVLLGLSARQAAIFFSNIDRLPDSNNRAAEAYAARNQQWFSDLVKRIGKNPLATLLLKRLSSEELQNQVPNIAFEGLSSRQSEKFFSKLASRNRNVTTVLNFVTQNQSWFNALVKRIDRNPITDLIVLNSSPQQLEMLEPNSLPLKGLEAYQAEKFLARLDEPTNSQISRALNYITLHQQWFNDIVTTRGENPLMWILLERWLPDELAQLPSDHIALQGIDREQARKFFTALVSPQGHDFTRMRKYATENKAWLDNLIDRNGENPLTNIIIKHPSSQMLMRLDPENDIALQGLSALQAGAFLLAMDRESRDTSNAQRYIIKYKYWFRTLVRKHGINPLIPLLAFFTRDEIAELVPDIILEGLSVEQAQEFFAKLVDNSRSRVALAVEYAQTHNDWFVELVNRTGVNPLLPLLLKYLSSEQLLKQPSNIALLGLSKNQTRSFLAHMTPEDAASYVNNNIPWFSQQGWEANELLLPNENNLVLGKADPLDISSVNVWQKPTVRPRKDGGTTRFGGQIIIQLENNPEVCEAAAQLAAKHPNTSVIVQLDFNAKSRVVFGNLNNLKDNLRWQLVGHGREGKNERNHQTLGGRSPQKLAEQLSEFSDKLGLKISPKHISLVGCSLASGDTTTSYLHQFISSLTEQGIHPTSVGAYATELSVNKREQKRLNDTGEKIILHKRGGQWTTAQKPEKTNTAGSGRRLLASLDWAENFETSMERLYRHNGLSGADWLPMLHTLKRESTHSRYYSLTLVRKDNLAASPEKKIVFTDDPHITNFIQRYDRQLAESKLEVEGIHGLNTAFIIQTWFTQRARDSAAKGQLPENLKTALQVHTYANFAQMTQGALDDGVKFLQLSHELMQEGTVANSLFKSFSHVSTGVGVGANLLSVGLSSYELAHAQNEAQRALYGTQLAFDLVSLGASVVSLGAGMAGAAAISSFAGALAVPLAGLGIGITALVMSTQVHIEKTKAVGLYFSALDNGYSKGGYQKIQIKTVDGTIHQVWENRPGIAITKLDLREQQLTYGNTGIYKTLINGIGSGYYNIVTMALPQADKRTTPINIRSGINHPSPTVRFAPDKDTPLILPSTPVYYIDYQYETFPGVTLRHDKGFEVLRRLEKNYPHNNNNFSFDFYCLPAEYAISELKFEYKLTPVEIFLDDNDRNIIMPTLSDKARDKIDYRLTGGNGTYHISLQEGATLTLKGGSDKTEWVLDTRSLARVNKLSINTDGKLEAGNMQIGFASDFKGIIRVISQNGSFLVMNRTQSKPKINQLSADVSRFKDWRLLHNHLKQISNTDFHNQPFVPVDNYLTSQNEKVGRAFYQTAKDRFIYTNQPDAAEFLRGAQLAKIENNIAWFYRDSSAWQVNIADGKVLREYVPINFGSPSTPSKSKMITDDQGRLCFIVEYQKKSGPIRYIWQLTEQAMTLVAIAGEEQDIPDMTAFSFHPDAQLSNTTYVLATRDKTIHRLSRRDGHNYHSWLKRSEQTNKYVPFLQANMATIAPEDIQPIPVKIGNKISYYFYSHQQQKLYFQPNDGLTQLTHQTRKAHEVRADIQTLFVLQEQLIAQSKDGTLWLADAQGKLHLAGVAANWLQAHRNNVMAHLRKLVTTADTLPALRLQGLSDMQGKSIMAWYDITADKLIQSGAGIEPSHTLNYRGLSSDGKQAWLYDVNNGQLYRQPVISDIQLTLNEKGQSAVSWPPAEPWSSRRYSSVVSTDDKLRLTTKEGAVLLLPKAAGAQDRPQLIAWQVGKQTEAQLATAIESLRDQVTLAPIIRLLKQQEGKAPTWYLTEQKTFLQAHGLNGQHSLHWLGLAAGQSNAYIHDRTTGDLWLTGPSRSTASERYRFIFLQQGKPGELGELMLQYAPSDKKKIIEFPKLKDADRLTVTGKTEGARYILDMSVLDHYRQITIEERGRNAIIRLPDILTHLSLQSEGNDLILYNQASNTRICIINSEQAARRSMKLQIGDKPAIEINKLVKEMYQLGVQIPVTQPSPTALMEMELQVLPTVHLDDDSLPLDQEGGHKIKKDWRDFLRFTAKSESDIARLRESMSALNLSGNNYGGMVRDTSVFQNEQHKLLAPYNN